MVAVSYIINSNMDKRHLHHVWTRFRRLNPLFFLALAILSGVIAVFALRANNQHMLQLRQAVYQVDKDNGDIQKALQDLQAYVTTHMNTNLSTGTSVYPPVQLKYTYDRLVQAQGSAVAQANQQLYSQAQAYCEQQNHADFSGRNRVPCIEAYVQQHNPQKLKQIPDALYKFSFVTPRWSPDLAGWSIVVAIASLVAFVISLITNRWFKKNVA